MCPARIFPAGFLLAQGDRRPAHVSVQDCKPQVPPRNPPGSVRHPALAVRRDVGGAVPHPGLRLRQFRAGGGPLQGRGPRLPVFALRQSDRDDVRAAHRRIRGRGSGARDRDRHGRGHARDDGPGQGRRPYRGVEGDLRLLPLRDGGLPAALRRHLDDRRRLRSRRLARGDAAEHQDLLPGDADQSQSRSARHRRDRQDRARGRRDAGRRQRVLDAAVAEPARTRRRLRGLFHHQAHRRPGPLPRRRHPRLAEIHHRQHPHLSSGRPALRCRRSTPGSCSRDWRRWRCACARRPTPRARWRPSLPSIRRCRG